MKYRDGYKYQLAEDESHQLAFIPPDRINHEWIYISETGIMMVKSGYAWDGCSGPTWDDKTNMTAGLIHDALYQLMRLGLLPLSFKDAADNELHRLCIKNGMMKLRADYYLWGVKKFGRKHADCKEPEPIEVP